MRDWIGWIATSFFTISYFVKSQVTLLWCQAIAALIWLYYGILIESRPVIVANVIVVTSAVISVIRLLRKQRLNKTIGDTI